VFKMRVDDVACDISQAHLEVPDSDDESDLSDDDFGRD